MIGVTIFAVLVASIPLVKDGYTPKEAISDAASGSYGYLQTIAFFSLGIGSLALAWGLWETLGTRGARIGAALVGLGWGALVVVAGIFPADPGDDPETTTGTIHLVASLVGDVVGLIGLVALSVAFGKRPAWRALARPATLLSAAAFLAFVVTVAAGDADWWGIPQRVYVGLVLAWFLLTASGLRAAARADGTADTAH